MSKFLTTTIVLTLILIPSTAVRGQSLQQNTGTTLEQTPLPTREKILRDNQNLNYRTNQQIFNRRVNNTLTECDSSAGSSNCEQAVPEAEAWRTNENLQNIEGLRLR